MTEKEKRGIVVETTGRDNVARDRFNTHLECKLSKLIFFPLTKKSTIDHPEMPYRFRVDSNISSSVVADIYHAVSYFYVDGEYVRTYSDDGTTDDLAKRCAKFASVLLKEV